MNKRNFKLIQGGKIGGMGMAAKGKTFSGMPAFPKMKFIGAMATNTRLMGVVGVIAHFRNERGEALTQVLHLDYEEYGIDGYQLFVDVSEPEIQKEIQKVTGGLGGNFVEIDYEAYRHLVYEAYLLDRQSVHIQYDILPTFPEILQPLVLKDQNLRDLYDLVGPLVETDLERLNYGLMRMTGHDENAFMYLSDVTIPSAWYQEVAAPGTLLKNTIHEVESKSVEGVNGLITYRCEALIDQYDRYKLIHLNLEIADTSKGRRIVGIKMISVLNISAYEASFQLRKREHIAVYEILQDVFKDFFEEAYPEMLINSHGAGDLFTQFNTNNQHVSKSVYYLSGDVYANYYITDEEQMVISTFDLENLDHIDMALSHKFEGMLAKIGEMTADQSILYDFVTSGYGNLYEYLEDTRP